MSITKSRTLAASLAVAAVAVAGVASMGISQIGAPKSVQHTGEPISKQAPADMNDVAERDTRRPLVQTTGRHVRVDAPTTNVDVQKDTGKVRVKAPHTDVKVDPQRGQVRVRAPYVDLNVRW